MVCIIRTKNVKFFVGKRRKIDTISRILLGFVMKRLVCLTHEVILTMSSIEERVKKIIVEQLGVEADRVQAEASIVDDLGADSLDTVELVMAFEEEFEAEIPDEDAEKLKTVGDAVKYIEAHINE